MSAKDDFLKQAKTVDREGMTDLLNYLESTDFFTAPASSKYHGSCLRDCFSIACQFSM